MIKFEDVKKLGPDDLIQFDGSPKTWAVTSVRVMPSDHCLVTLYDPANLNDGTYFTEKQLGITNWVKKASKQAVEAFLVESSSPIQPTPAKMPVGRSEKKTVPAKKIPVKKETKKG